MSGTLTEILEGVLNRVDSEGMRDYMTNAEIAAWMVREAIDRGVTIQDRGTTCTSSP